MSRETYNLIIRLLLALILFVWGIVLMVASSSEARADNHIDVFRGKDVGLSSATTEEEIIIESLKYVSRQVGEGKHNETLQIFTGGGGDSEGTGRPAVSIEDLIIKGSTEVGIDPETALRIAKCESSLNPKARNKHSTATGLYQFTKGTWQWIGAEAQGLDRENPEDSLQMFLKYYPKYPQWWQCL